MISDIFLRKLQKTRRRVCLQRPSWLLSKRYHESKGNTPPRIPRQKGRGRKPLTKTRFKPDILNLQKPPGSSTNFWDFPSKFPVVENKMKEYLENKEYKKVYEIFHEHRDNADNAFISLSMISIMWDAQIADEDILNMLDLLKTSEFEHIQERTLALNDYLRRIADYLMESRNENRHELLEDLTEYMNSSNIQMDDYTFAEMRRIFAYYTPMPPGT